MCVSGTPVSPLVPSPIAPPGPVANVGPVGAPPGKMGSAPGPSATSGSTSSPGSDRDQDTWFSRPQMAPGPGLRSITPDPGDLGWGSTGPQDLEQTSRRHGTGSYGHNSPAKAPGGPLPDLFGRLNLKGGQGQVDPTTGLATENLLSAAAQLQSLSNNFDLLQPPSSSMAPGLPDTVYSTGGPGPISGPYGPSSAGSRFRGNMMTSAMTSSSTTPIFSQPQPPMSAGFNKSLNPNAPDFSRGGGGMFVPNNIRPSAGPLPGSRPPQNLPQQKLGPTGPGFGPGGFNNFGGGNNFNAYNNQSGSNLQSLLTNQSINALLSSYGANLGSAPSVDLSGLNDFSGRTLSELTDMLAPDNPLPGFEPPSPSADLNPKFSSRPIGAERRTGPSPIGHNQARSKPVVDNNHPFGVWDLPPSYTENNPTNDNLSFNLLPSSMTGQTLQPLFDNLSKGTVFNELQYNGTGGLEATSGYGLGQVGQIPTSLTPSKNPGPSFSDWGSGAGSAPPSGGKMPDRDNTVGFRPDAAQVRRNMVGS